jgi:ribonuclease P protein component
VLRAGRRIRARLLDVKLLSSPLGHLRVGIVVPKYGFTAVRRNTLKRRLRELARHHLLALSNSSDMVIRARREAYAATFADLRTDVERLAPHVVETT